MSGERFGAIDLGRLSKLSGPERAFLSVYVSGKPKPMLLGSESIWLERDTWYRSCALNQSKDFTFAGSSGSLGG